MIDLDLVVNYVKLKTKVRSKGSCYKKVDFDYLTNNQFDQEFYRNSLFTIKESVVCFWENHGITLCGVNLDHHFANLSEPTEEEFSLLKMLHGEWVSDCAYLLLIGIQKRCLYRVGVTELVYSELEPIKIIHGRWEVIV